MQFPKVPLLLGVIGATGLAFGASAQAQNAPRPNVPLPNIPPPNPTHPLTTVDIYGNMVRNPNANLPAAQPNLGGNNAATSDRYQRGNGRNDNRGNGRDYNRNNWNNGRGGNYGGGNYGGGNYNGGNYYVPVSPYYSYPYGAQAYNNYYYPQLPTTTIIAPPVLPGQRPATITSIPFGTVYNGYPGGGYGYNYGYPLPSYGTTYSPYNGVPYPFYGGSTTYITGNGAGGIYSQSQTNGYGVSIGRGGLSVQLGNSRTSNSTTVKRR